MNYLAHAYLSFKEPDILVGNLISDFVKGKKKFNYSLPIQKGIVYDHFLANDKLEFPSNDTLENFAHHTYQQLDPYKTIFPEKFQIMFHYMQLQNWLYNYQFKNGIYNSFRGMVRRAKFMNDAEPAFAIFEERYDELKNCYELFFPEVRNFALTQLAKLHEEDQKKPDIR